MLGVEVLLDRLDDVCLGAQEVILSDAIKLQFSRSFDHFLAKLIQRSSGWANVTCTARLYERHGSTNAVGRSVVEPVLQPWLRAGFQWRRGTTSS